MDSLLSKYFSSSKLSVISEGSISVTQSLAAVTAIAAILIFLCFYSRSTTIYLLDYVCYLPPDHLRVPYSNFIEHFEMCNFDQEIIDFEMKVLERSGIGVEACMPEPVHEIPPDGAMKHAQAEIKLVLFTIVKDLLSKHNVNPKSIDIIVSNCSLFCPTPSITSMIINKFGLRSNIKSVNLSGMGCSAGLLSISLVKDLLKVHKKSLALVLSMEAVAPNGYTGNAKSKLIANALFRMGGAAILQDSDEDEIVGVSLSRALLHVAASTLRTNITELGPLVLPYSEQLRYAWSAICKKIRPNGKEKEIYVPDFRKAFEHFCIHAGGKAVIDAIEESLKLQKEDGEASRMALYRFGNTSSSSLWYELCYLEAKGKVKKGDRVWQIAFGSGFKCNSAAWKCISDIDPNVKNAWSDRIHLYPVEIPVFDC